MMLFTKNTTNTFYMTLWERATISSPYYLFCFFDYMTQSWVKTILRPESTSERYDKVVIIEKSSPDTDNGEVEMKGESGEYRVYEKSGIDYTMTGTLIENGLWRLRWSSDSDKPSYNNNDERIVYNG